MSKDPPDTTGKRARLAAAVSQPNAAMEALKLVSQGVVICDYHQEVTYHNDLAEPWLAGHVGGGLVYEALQEVLRTATNGKRTNRTLELLGPPRRSLSITAVPVSGPDGVPTGAVAVLDDTTERRRLEAVRRDFVANVSHELKTPIGALGLLAETLIMERDPTTVSRLAQRMHVECIRVGQVIDDLLNFSRLESQKEMLADLVRADRVVEQACENVRYAAEHREIEVTVKHSDGSEGAMICGNERELVSAVHHLLENALKYSDDGGVVNVEIHADGQWTEIAIRDQGVGIPAEYLDRIFERFYRVDDTRTRNTGGSGLGLSIVRHVVARHGGEVRVTSQQGEGSTFTVRVAALRSLATQRLGVEGGTDG